MMRRRHTMGPVLRCAVVLVLLQTAPAAWGQGFWQPRPASEPEATLLRDVGFDQRLDESLPLDASFRDERGTEVRLGEYFGRRPVILALVYYECPMLCTLVLNGLTSALNVLRFDVGKEFEVVTISIDPRDTPTLAARKKATYLDRYARAGAEAGWHFLTGEQASIKRVAEAIGFRYAFDPEQQQFAHAAGVVVLTPQGRIARYYYGVEYPPRDLRLGLVEAGEGRIGSPIDQLLLYCYHYDPHTGRYGATVMNLLRLGGAVTLLALGGFVGLMVWRESRRRHRETVWPDDGQIHLQ
jgi:protein SCO1/2